MKAFLLLAAVVAVGVAAAFQSSPTTTGTGYFIRLHPYDAKLHGAVNVGAGEQPPTRRGGRRQLVYQRLRAESEAVARPFLPVLDAEFGVLGGEVEVFWIDTLLYVRYDVMRSAAKRTLAKRGLTMSTMSNDDDDEVAVEWWLGEVRAHNLVRDVFPNSIVAEVVATVDEPGCAVPAPDGNGQLPMAWGVEKIRARQWNGHNGTRVRVATIDTGVNWQHESLRGSYAGKSAASSPTSSLPNSTTSRHDYAWFDPLEFRNDPWWCWQQKGDRCSPKECCLDEPFDIVGHGTHVTATIAGSRESGVGVAPGVEWITAKGCRDGNCFFYGLTKSAQWVMCPTRVDGSDVDCERGADIVSNSWGSKVYNPNDDFYFKYIAAWREAGMIPIFSNGNSGPSCASVSAPGAFRTVIGVGATDADDRLSRFSSRGPGPYGGEMRLVNDGYIRGGASSQLVLTPNKVPALDSMYARQKPDFTAPGRKILSACAKDIQAYQLMSGTSMATPHVAGMAALIMSELLAKNPDAVVTFEQLYDIISNGTVQDLPTPDGQGGSPVRWLPDWPWPRQQCDRSTWTEWPNLFYGHGRIDAVKAMQALT